MATAMRPDSQRFMEPRRKRYDSLWGQLETQRASFMADWSELGDYFKPRRVRRSTSDNNKGGRRSKNIIDTTPAFAARTLASGMMSGVTSPARPWFRLTTPDPELAELPSVKNYLHTVTQRQQTVFLRSNLYNALPILYSDMGIFGTGAMAVLEDDEDVIRCLTFPVGSYLIANDAKLRVRVFMREFQLTIRQVVEQFGTRGADGRINNWRNFSDRIRTAYEQAGGSIESTVDVRHVITPNTEFNPDRLDSKYKRFLSCYYECGDNNEDRFLEETGFDEFPILASRWEVTGEDAYGTDSPGYMALGDNKQLQLGEKKSLQAIEKMVSPPMVAPPGMRTSKLSILPGEVSYVTEGQHSSFRPALEVRFDVNALEAKNQQVRNRINEAFFADLFLMLAQLDRKQITATEIMERREEKMLALGPVLERLNQDLLNPLIDRTFAIMDRKGLLPEPPEELQGMPLKVEYISVMAQAQQQAGLAGMDRFAGFILNIAAQTKDMAVLDKWDVDQTIDEYAIMTGVPPRIVVPDEDVLQARQARAQVAKERHDAEVAAQNAQTAQTLSQTDTQRPSALTEMTGADSDALPTMPAGVM